MTASLIDLVGYCAAVLTTVSFVPQVWLTLRSRDVSGISLGMYSLFTAGIALWLLYGLLQHNLPIVAANAITLVLALIVLVMRLRLHKPQSP
ncbi:SemiSWEET transporter [Thiomonas sp.]|jgi:MtN3 and saliva related transmembrane protein|uniref:SemiSWEET transporter n=1 Tax=Thiomonas sp. TaxID=2047785 RepID=UPI0026340B8E|nr:SemiSWEET transporter [Thiomonas sp.]